ncbi:hypothetical protein [Pandoraea oxalativorans]|uniref:Uncharacterized protein n=1 Tax=Pandoraea oxalativorans TaxID=573737 RepID=A0A0G3IBQ9_9BURK|nr:hypothetical protein [Pandoraea oxalativorans]AKK24712.1 hypothetical protein MB84_28240 [Pandoraea oxalativorans]
MAQTQYRASVSPDPVVVNAAFTHALRDFLRNIPRFLNDFDAIGGSGAGHTALTDCLHHIEHVETKCRLGPVERPEILVDLAQAAQFLDVAKQEVIDQLPTLVPGFVEKLFADFGLLFGLIAAAALLCAAPSWALAAGGLLLAGFYGQGWAMEREDARERLVERYAPQLDMIRSATVRAESAYTIAYLKARVSGVAAARYEALLASPRRIPANDALSGTASLPQMHLRADTNGSPLDGILLEIQTGAISIPDEQARALLCQLLDAEALAQQQGSAAGDQENALIAENFLRLLQSLKFRLPAMQLILEGNAGEKRIWTRGAALNRLLREHTQAPIDIDEPPPSTRDALLQDTELAKARLCAPLPSARDAQQDVETGNDASRHAS